MSKKKNKISDRERNAFPFLNDSVKKRLKDSGAIDMKGNYRITKDGHYWSVSPIDSNRKIK